MLRPARRSPLDPDEYLETVLQEQTLTSGSDELEALRKQGRKVKQLLRTGTSQHSVSVRYAGSYKKGTMIRASYDLDVLCYFPSDTEIGDNLQEIYEAVAEILEKKYVISRKRSAIKLWDPADDEDPVYFHVDVVPGRFVDGDDGDVWLNQNRGQKDRLKTNPEEQISHVRNSDLRDAIKLAKIWREEYGFELPTFVLELLVIDLLAGREDDSLSDQMERFWSELRERAKDLTVEDPANSNNDLSDLLDAAARANLLNAAKWALRRVEDDSWDDIFGQVEEQSKGEAAAALKGAAASISDSKTSRSYCPGER